MEPTIFESTAIADFDANIGHIATAIAAIREAEISSGVPEDDLLTQLDHVGHRVFQHVRQQCGLETDIDMHWCVLLLPHVDDFVGSGTMTSLLELCATAGLVHNINVKIPQLSAEQITNLLNCTLNGLTYIRDGSFLLEAWLCYDGSLLDTDSFRRPALVEKSFES
jgi:hypothetical protein